ncbi:MAG: hypothetical protein IPG55_09670 [Saprospiraceae bacterium]|nr:hypothetical protein [Candidatus Defluviibacterium haderslevense]MBK7243858.1 hypothetical protein [Candidatus Defluviibacterium haderslevense]
MELELLILLIALLLSFILLSIIIFVIIYQKKIVQLEKNKISIENDKIKLEKQNELNIAESVIRSQENERKKIGEELHDDLAPLLVSANLHLKNYLSLEQPENKNKIQEAIHLINCCIDRIRNISHVLHPAALQEFGITFALRDFCNIINSSNLCQIESHSNVKEISFDQDKQLMLYRIVQELVLNSVKHGNATSFVLIIDKKENIYSFSLMHNGLSFTIDDYYFNLTNSVGLGLKNIQQRLNILDGTISFSSQKIDFEQLNKIEILISSNS